MDQIPCDHVLFVIASYTAIREKKILKTPEKKKRKKRKQKQKQKKKEEKRPF